MLSINKFRIEIYRRRNGIAPYSNWAKTLDKASRARITARISRFSEGHFGDFKRIDSGLYEARIFIGPGYRVYFGIQGSDLVVLLLGGDKSTQKKDIQKSKLYFADYRKRKNAHT